MKYRYIIIKALYNMWPFTSGFFYLYTCLCFIKGIASSGLMISCGRAPVSQDQDLRLDPQHHHHQKALLICHSFSLSTYATSFTYPTNRCMNCFHILTIIGYYKHLCVQVSVWTYTLNLFGCTTRRTAIPYGNSMLNSWRTAKFFHNCITLYIHHICFNN